LSIQQQQDNDERRRQEEEGEALALAESLRIAAYADHWSGVDRDRRHFGREDGAQLTPWGENIAIGTAAITRQQIAVRHKRGDK